MCWLDGDLNLQDVHIMSELDGYNILVGDIKVNYYPNCGVCLLFRKMIRLLQP